MNTEILIGRSQARHMESFDGRITVYDGYKIVGYYTPPIDDRPESWSYYGAVRAADESIVSQIVEENRHLIEESARRNLR